MLAMSDRGNLTPTRALISQTRDPLSTTAVGHMLQKPKAFFSEIRQFVLREVREYLNDASL